MLTLFSLVAAQFVIPTTSGDSNDDEDGMTSLGFQYPGNYHDEKMLLQLR